MPLIVSERDAIATAQAARLLYVSLHSADPTTIGDFEASNGGTPAYTRLALSPNTSFGGTVVFNEVTFNVEAGSYTHFGTWTASVAGTFLGGNPLAVAQTMASHGQIKVTVSVPVT